MEKSGYVGMCNGVWRASYITSSRHVARRVYGRDGSPTFKTYAEAVASIVATAKAECADGVTIYHRGGIAESITIQQG